MEQTSILKYIESKIRFQSSFVTYTGTHDSLLTGGGLPYKKDRGEGKDRVVPLGVKKGIRLKSYTAGMIIKPKKNMTGDI